MSVSDWDNEYAKLARTASQYRSSSSTVPQQQQQVLCRDLETLGHNLSSLPLQSNEIQRRRNLILNLIQQQSGSAGGCLNNNNKPPQGSQQRTQMTMALQQQDALIDELAVGVGQLRDQSTAIADEATLHNTLLTRMDDGLDAAAYDLQAQTARAADLRQSQSLWKLQLTVAGLLILLVLEILIGLSP